MHLHCKLYSVLLDSLPNSEIGGQPEFYYREYTGRMKSGLLKSHVQKEVLSYDLDVKLYIIHH